ncbi:uncharacterized protein LOC110018784 [Phalaenopsis equestris]|uniref:uncharacterized protein LOC110018784 n=1 Tax=Phalaenopsis equestris TaxID=78828 RepID=UPI0009E63885|nr:uncharacterized protein LOC110018784 [Phalaenopsis equestris]
MRREKETESLEESLEPPPASATLRQLPQEIDRSFAASPSQISPEPSFRAVSDPIEENDGEEDDFEFAFMVLDPDTSSSLTADEIFSNGQIRPVYPIFNRNLFLEGEGDLGQPLRRLMLEERESPSVSTGSLLRWRIRDLVIRRSQSDGKEKFVFLETEEKKKDKGKKAMDGDIVTANPRSYDRIAQVSTAKPGGARRKSFLPYKTDIVGFFASVNGMNRVHHPF